MFSPLQAWLLSKSVQPTINWCLNLGSQILYIFVRKTQTQKRKPASDKIVKCVSSECFALKMRSNAKTSVERKMQYRATVGRIQLTISVLMTGCQIFAFGYHLGFSLLFCWKYIQTIYSKLSVIESCFKDGFLYAIEKESSILK